MYWFSCLQCLVCVLNETQLFLNGKICLWSNNWILFCVNEYEKILKCLLFLCILGFLNAWWPFEIRMWSSFRFICPVEKIRGRESIHNCEKHWKSICIFVLKTLAGWRERDTLEEKSRYSSVEEEKRLSREVAYWVTMGCFEPKSCKIIQSFKRKVGWKQGQLFW